MIRILLITSVLGSVAVADTPTERADALFKRGKELMAAKRYTEACTAFDRSFEIEANPATLLNRADCREKNGQVATAWKLFVDAEKLTHASADDAQKQMNATALSRSAKLEARVPHLTIRAPQDARITINQIPTEPLQVAPIDPGTYAVEATAPGRITWSRQVVIKEGGNEQLSITLDAPRVTEPPLRPDPVVSAPKPEDHAIVNTPRSRTPVVVAGGAGVVFGAVGIGLFVSASSTYDRSKKEVDDAEQERLWQSSNHRRYLAEAFTVAAVGCAGAAVYLFVRSKKTERRVAVVPTASTSSFGLAVARSW